MNSRSFKNIYKLWVYKSFNMYKEDLALNSRKCLICRETHQNQIIYISYIYMKKIYHSITYKTKPNQTKPNLSTTYLDYADGLAFLANTTAREKSRRMIESKKQETLPLRCMQKQQTVCVLNKKSPSKQFPYFSGCILSTERDINIQ